MADSNGEVVFSVFGGPFLSVGFERRLQIAGDPKLEINFLFKQPNQENSVSIRWLCIPADQNIQSGFMHPGRLLPAVKLIGLL